MPDVESTEPRLERNDTDKMNTHRLAGYSKGLRFGDWLFTAGATAGDHVPVDPFGASTVAPEARVDPNYWVGSPIKRQVLYIVREKLLRVLEAAGCGLEDVVCAHVYLNDTANDYASFNEAWQELFPERPPSTVVVPVDGFGVVHAKTEISFVVARPGSMPVDVVNSSTVPAFPGHAPQAIRAGDMIWCSTLVAADARGLLPSAVNPPGLPYFQSAGGRQMQTIVDNLARLLRAAGSDLQHVVKLLVYCSDLAELPAFVDVWRPAFADSPPAISVIQVKGPFLAPGCTVAVDAVAVAA
jgi:enamine deaminase RidA (YjgF/YER057c/UK114 family)